MTLLTLAVAGVQFSSVSGCAYWGFVFVTSVTLTADTCPKCCWSLIAKL